MSPGRWIAVGALLGAAAVGAGAFGAHALKDRLSPEMVEVWRTGVLYHALHALALVGFGLFRTRAGGSSLAGWAFLAGTLLFSGSLYGLALGGPRWLGMVTPFGGIALIAGWLALALAAWRARG